jgi:amidase|tara:strand:- start:4338 stop:5975 length:1638 start_codon:yes stop_codon:yes gene_type:complete
MKKIVLFFIVLATVSCNENSLKVWTNYNQSSEILENSKNDNQRLRYNRIQSISNDKNNLISDFKNEISKFLVERYDQIKDLIIEKSIPEIQKSIFQKQFSYYELTLFYLSRIYLIEFDKEQYLNSIISINKNVLKEAKLSDQNSKNKNHLIYGIPILLKDNVGFDGLATTAGAFSLKDNLTDDSYIVKKLKENGAIILGKTNLSEWANYFCSGCPNGYSSMGGQTLNPYGRKKIDTGGSSSGSGVATASNLTAVSIGSETSGSILSPASSNSLVGMKPTIGSVSRSGIIPISSTLDTAGPMTKSVVDNIIVMNAIMGYDNNDSSSYKSNPIDLTLIKKSRVENYSLGYYSNFYKNDSLYKKNIDLLKSSGAKMIEIKQLNIPLTGFRKLLDEDMRIDLVKYFKSYGNKDLLVNDIKSIIEYNSLDSITRSPYGQGIFRSIINDTLSSSSFKSLKEKLSKNGNKFFDSAFDKYKIDAVVSINNFHAAYAAVAHNPCLTVPMGFNSGNQPAGLTFIGKSKSEQKLYEIGYAYEQISKRRIAPENSKN